MALAPPIIMLLMLLGVAVAVLAIIFVLVPMMKGLGWLLMGLFRGVGWLVAHVFEFVAGTVGDVFRFVSTIPVMLVLAPLSVLSVVVGRWSSAAHFARSVRRELQTAGSCLYRIALRRPLKLVWLHGLLEGVEQRIPAALAEAPGADRPARRNRFDGYTITGSLKGGGSGAKLYIATPEADVRRRYPTMPDQVVIKAFTLDEDSALPQIVRESRALESAKKLGAVFEHGQDADRFWYVMPYHDGDHLGVVTRQLHAESGADGLSPRALRRGLGYVRDLTRTLDAYHGAGLWHKDVKPENVIVEGNEAHVVDLGLVTPLSSAMTLTTHGTEYFRDPELVRQALRGIKVHQVDGAKFDVFGIGAVLYFLVENDFPAHGALSRFKKRSPEAVKWIIRRAMADYSHRYPTAKTLLDDLAMVAGAPDPYAVRPADLPSLGGEQGARDLDPSRVADAGAAAPPPLPQDAPPPPPADAKPRSGRPSIKVTNWWTGAYEVNDDPSSRDARSAKRAKKDKASKAPFVSVHVVDPREAVAAVAAAMPDETKENLRRTRDAIQKAARERVRRARNRAAGVRRAAGRARAMRPHRRTRPLVDGGAVLVVLLVLGAVAFVKTEGFEELRREIAGSSRGPGASSVAGAQPDGFGGHPLLVLGVEAFEGHPTYEQELTKLLERRARQGYRLLQSERIEAEGARELLDRWYDTNGRDDGVDEALEDLLARWSLYGVLTVRIDEDGRGLHDRLVYSTRSDAEDRRLPVVEVAASDLPLIVVNDHRDRTDGEVDRAIARLVSMYEASGWRVSDDPVAEASLRTVMPTSPDERRVPVTQALEALLAQHQLAGVLRVTGESVDDISVQLVQPTLETDQAIRLRLPETTGAPGTSSALPFDAFEPRVGAAVAPAA